MNFETGISTPAFVIDESRLEAALQACLSLSADAGCRMLYSPKALAIPYVLQYLAQRVDGFSCSSLNEARLARSIIGERGTVHLVTPGIATTHLREIAELCDFTVLNSLSHWELYSQVLANEVSLGLRVNPGRSFVDDDRYDPCRLHSKLGVPLETLMEFLEAHPHNVQYLHGLHFHNNCDSERASDLALTVAHLMEKIGGLFESVRWINFGGGYLLSELHDPEVFCEAVRSVKRKFDVEVFVEPGAALVRSAGSLVSRVLDLFESDGVTIAVLDTTVNHMPEVLEYEFTPSVQGANEDGMYKYLLAGCTCLAGDQFGIVGFDQPLSIGSFVTFDNCGAYTFSRANTFNGVDLPSIYCQSVDGELKLIRRHEYADFANRAGAASHVGL